MSQYEQTQQKKEHNGRGELTKDKANTFKEKESPQNLMKTEVKKYSNLMSML